MMHERVARPRATFAERDAREIAAEIEAHAHRINVLANHASSELATLKAALGPKLPSGYQTVAEWELLGVILDVVTAQAHEIGQLSERIELWGHPPAVT